MRNPGPEAPKLLGTQALLTHRELGEKLGVSTCAEDDELGPGNGELWLSSFAIVLSLEAIVSAQRGFLWKT